MKRIAIFCSSKTPHDLEIIEQSKELIAYLVSKDIEIVYGGANVGLMGIIADEALKLDGKVIGVMPQDLIKNEIAHEHLTKIHFVDTMHQRKALMAELADAFIALPGGFGTFEEIFEVTTWNQIGIHNKPTILYNINHYYQGIKETIDYAHKQGMLQQNLLNIPKNLKEISSILKL
ncbi:TIGR00730 family Rossman fold protein [Erysipelothrix urinaevulpis]|uniref:LOG family protein n=1 Tax=Erysipelothrix urinaevulpis TaxID=2683717 RepID=UPI00135900E2|nr:TIGR00730 family Rossman fold protein [Erysipelothrix urinaevulpis]